MFDALTDKFSTVFRSLSGRGKLSEENIRESMREVRTALLEADVNFQVVKEFTDKVVDKAIGQHVINSLQPGQLMVKIVYDELLELLGPVDTRIYFVQPGPTVIMMCGLQGSGKTTTCGKLAMYLTGKGHHPLLAAVDLQRPAAVEQLRIIGEQVGVPVYTEPSKVAPHGQVARGAATSVARAAIAEAKKQAKDVVILDTAGRLAIDQELMNELKEILTKLDSDTRGGALLSAKYVTGKPVKFLGVGEKLDRLEEFRPEGMAQRILGMGDIVGLVSEAMEKFDAEETAKLQEKMEKGQFTLDDFIAQMGQIKKLGPMSKVMGMIPGMSEMSKNMNMGDGDVEK